MSGKREKQLCIALPISSFLPAQGGAEIGLHNIASRLRSLGHRPVVIASYTHVKALRRTGWRLPYDVVAYPPRLLTWRGKGSRAARFLLNRFHGRLQRRYGFDVWHATFGFPVGVSVIEFCNARALPHLVRCVGEDIQVRPDIGYGMRLNPAVDADVRYWLPRAQCLVAITRSVADEYRQLGVDNSRVADIPNGVDVKRFVSHKSDKELRGRLGIAEGVPLFLALGRYHVKKNFEQLLEAAAALRARKAGLFHVLIAGTGVKTLEDARTRLGVQDLVTLVEPEIAKQAERDIRLPNDEILDFYKAADVFVMPSIVETFGIVTVEAMAADLPVIAADSPGSRDVIRGGEDGLMYDGSANALVGAMQLLLDKKHRASWAEVSRKRVGYFDWDQVVGRYVDTYRTLMEAVNVKDRARQDGITQ